MEFIDYVRIVRRRWLVLVVTSLFGVMFALLTVPESRQVQSSTSYEAQAALLVSANSSVPTSYMLLYAKQGEVPARVGEAIDSNDAPEVLAEMVKVEASTTDPLILVSASGVDPNETAMLANAFAEQLITYVAEQEDATRQSRAETLEGILKRTQSDLTKVEARIARDRDDLILQAQRDALKQRYSSTYQELISTLGSMPGENLTMFQRAEAIGVVSGGFTVTADVRSRVVLFGGAALLLALIGVLILERFDPRPRSRAELERAFGMATLAVVPRIPGADPEALPFVVREPAAPQSRIYRGLRAAIHTMAPRFLAAEGEAGIPRHIPGNRVLLVTGARAGVGTTTTVGNLAAAIADSGARALIIDANIQSPDLSRQFGAHPPGFVEVLAGAPGSGESWNRQTASGHLANASRDSSVPGVRVVSAGAPGVYRGAEPHRVRSIVESARESADITLIDGEALLEGVQSIDIAPFVDGIIVVARLGTTTRSDASHLTSIITQLQVPCLGLVIVDAPRAPYHLRSLMALRRPLEPVTEPDPLQRV